MPTPRAHSNQRALNSRGYHSAHQDYSIPKWEVNLYQPKHMINSVQTPPRTLIVFQTHQTKLRFAKWRYKPDPSEVAYPITKLPLCAKTYIFTWIHVSVSLGSNINKWCNRGSSLQNSKLRKENSSSVKLPSLPITFPLLPLQIKDKCTIHCWKKKKS